MTVKTTHTEVLFTSELRKGVTLSLCKYGGSSGKCFYALENSDGYYKLEYGNTDILQLIKQLEHEVSVYESMSKKHNVDYTAVKEWKAGIANKMKTISR